MSAERIEHTLVDADLHEYSTFRSSNAIVYTYPNLRDLVG